MRALAAGPLETVADLPQDHPGLADLEFELLEPVRVSGRITASGQDSYYWEGRIRTGARAACRRCLEPTEVALDQPVRLLFTEDEAADDPGVMVIPRNAKVLDLTEAVREELILAAPGFPLCREDCRGLCPRCGADLNQGPCGCRSGSDPRRKALEELPRRSNDNEER